MKAMHVIAFFAYNCSIENRVNQTHDINTN